MKTRFQNQQCPLCNKVLKLKSVAGVTTFYCPDEDTADGNNNSHYEVESDGKQTIQHIYAFPYAVDNFDNATRSRIYLWDGKRWQFFKEVSYLKPQPQEIMLDLLYTVAPPSYDIAL